MLTKSIVAAVNLIGLFFLGPLLLGRYQHHAGRAGDDDRGQ